MTVGYDGSIRLDVTPARLPRVRAGAPARPGTSTRPTSATSSLYLSYFGAALPVPERAFVEPELDQQTRLDDHRSGPSSGIGEGANGVVVRQRDYRLALVTDPSYADYFAAGADDGDLQHRWSSRPRRP